MAPRGLPLALLLGAAYALHPPPTNGLRKRNLYRTQTQYKTDSADGAGSFDRAVDALRAKGDAAAVKALQADVADIVVKIDGQDVDVTEYAREHPGGVAVLRKFHGRDASKAFHAAKHSKAALDRMRALRPRQKRKLSRAPRSSSRPRTGRKYTRCSGCGASATMRSASTGS